MSEHAERYVRLALRLARHDEGVVESYYGPPEMATGVDAEPLTAPIDLVAEADRLLADLPDAWLRDQVVGLRARAGLLAGERWSYADEVEACFGVRPTLTDEATLRAAYERLETLLPGPGSLRDRYQAWERATQVPADRVPAVVDAVVEESRAHARRLFGLPEGEGFDVEYVSGQGWMAFHEYAGGLRAQVSVNTDLPRSGVELLHTVLHETYAGHHAESCLKEVALVRGRGLLEQAIVVVPTAQSLVSEGLAELGPSLLLDGEHRASVRSGRARRRGRHRPRARPDRRGRRRAGAADPGRCRPAAARRRLVRERGARVPPAVGTRRRHPARARRPLRRRSRRTGGTSCATRRASCAAGST